MPAETLEDRIARLLADRNVEGESVWVVSRAIAGCGPWRLVSFDDDERPIVHTQFTVAQARKIAADPRFEVGSRFTRLAGLDA